MCSRRVDTTASDSIIHITTRRNMTPIDLQDEQFDVGDSAPLAGDAGDDDNVAGTLVYRNGSTGQVVTISTCSRSPTSARTTAPCSAPSRSSERPTRMLRAFPRDTAR